LDNGIEYRKYRPGDETGIVALLKKSFPKWSRRSFDYWRWKYTSSPQGTSVRVAVDGEKVVSVICNLIFNIKLGDKIIKCYYGDDTATDPDYRGRGLYTNLLKIVRTPTGSGGSSFGFWETENPIIAKASTVSKNFLFPFQLCNMIKIKDVDKYLKNSDKATLIHKLGFTVLKSVSSLTTLTSAHDKIAHDYSITSVKKFDEGINAFWERVKVDYNYIIEKKRDYLNWRYCTENTEEYNIRLATKGDDILGYSALRCIENGDSLEGTIMDLLALTERPDVAESLIEDALKQFELRGANSVYCQVISGHPYQKLLTKKGFIDVSRASKSLIYYTCSAPDFSPKRFSEYDPKSIYFNFY
jgi:hypothetical protein